MGKTQQSMKDREYREQVARVTKIVQRVTGMSESKSFELARKAVVR
jgi:hypothetical protein